MAQLPKNIVDIYAESDAGIMSDDAVSALRIENVNAGAGLVVKQSGGNVTTSANANALRVEMSGNAAPTVAAIQVLASTASAAMFEFKGFLASTASMGSIVRGVRVKYGDSYGWLPIYASATFI